MANPKLLKTKSVRMIKAVPLLIFLKFKRQ